MKKFYYNLKHSLSLLGCMLFLGTTTVFAQLPDPVFYYKFEDGSGTFVTNESGGVDGEIMGNADDNWVDGYLGGGFQFDGSTFIAVPQQGLKSGNASFAAWVKGYSGGRIKTIFSAGDNEGGGGFGPENEIHLHLEEAATDIWAGGEASFVQYTDESKDFFIYSDPEKGLSDPAVPPVNPTTFIDTTWRHIAVVWGGGKVKMYVNGEVLVDEDWSPVGASYNISTIRIGSMLNGGRAFEGVLDEVQAWDWILSDAEVMDVYGQSVGLFDRDIPSFQVNAYPNPVKDHLNVEFTSQIGKVAVISLINATGQIMSQKKFTMFQNISQQRFEINNMTAGMYLVKVDIEGDVSFQKVIID